MIHLRIEGVHGEIRKGYQHGVPALQKIRHNKGDQFIRTVSRSEQFRLYLKEMAEFEGYMKDASEEFKALEQKLSHNLDRDLDYFAKDIKNMIAQDIIKRYYFQRGGIIQQLKDDNDLNEAVKVLGDPAKYKEMLSVPVAKN